MGQIRALPEPEPPVTRPLNKVLYVEDEADIRAVAEIALAKLGGLEVRTCEDGRFAVAAVKSFEPDLVLLDVMMPMAPRRR